MLDYKEVINELFAYSDVMREFLLENKLCWFQLEEIIKCAPMSIERKLELIKQLKEVPSEDSDTYYTDALKLERAIAAQTEADLIFTAHIMRSIDEYGKRFSDNNFHRSNCPYEPFTSFKRALEYLYSEAAEDRVLYNGDFFKICSYKREGDEFVPYYAYYIVNTLDGKSGAAFFVCHTEENKYRDPESFNRSVDMNIPTPFKKGDVLKFRAMPSAREVVGVVVENSSDDCCALRVAFYDELKKEFTERAVKHGLGIQEWHRDAAISLLFYVERI